MKNLGRLSAAFVRWLGVGLAAMLIFLAEPPLQANAALEITNVINYSGKQHFTYGEEILLGFEFNEPVVCPTSGASLSFEIINPDVVHPDIPGPSRAARFDQAVSADRGHPVVRIELTKWENDQWLEFHSGLLEMYNIFQRNPYFSGTEYQVSCQSVSSGEAFFLTEASVIMYNQHFFSGDRAIYIDLEAPELRDHNQIAAHSGTYKPGDTIDIDVYFNELVSVPEDASMELNTGKTAQFVEAFSDASGNYLRFTYHVQPGDHMERLEIVSINGSITDQAGNEWNSSQYDPNQHGFIPNSIDIQIDEIPPDIDANCTACHAYSQSPAEVITATDHQSGIGELHYEWSTSEDKPSSYSQPIMFTGNPSQVADEVLPPENPVDGAYYLHVRAADSAGNVSETYFGPYHLDRTPPMVFADPDQGAGGDSITVMLTTDDADGSGVQAIHFRWDEAGWNTQSSAQADAVSPAAEGQYMLHAYAVDKVGNTSSTWTFGPYIIDRTPPQPSAAYVDHHIPKQSHTVNIELTGNREGETGSFSYLWTESNMKPGHDDERWEQKLPHASLPASASVDTPDQKDGNWYLHIKTEDDVGNSGIFTVGEDVPGGVSFWLDNTPPLIVFQPDGNQGIYAKSSATQMMVDGSTSNLEAYSIEYVLLDEGMAPDDMAPGDWRTAEDGHIKIEGQSGLIRIHVMVTDEAGNASKATSKPFAVDHLPPQGDPSFSNTHGHTNVQQIGVEFTAEDNASSIELRYALADEDWGPWLSYAQVQSEVILFDHYTDEEGIYPIHVQYRDEAENESDVYTIELTYDTTSPTVTAVTYEPLTVTNQPVTVTVFYDDHFSPGAQSFDIEDNGIHSLVIYDLAGNEASVDVDIRHIDKILPEVKFHTNGTTTNRQAVATIVTASDNVSEPERIELSYAWSVSRDESPLSWNAMNNGDEIELDSVDGEWFLWVKAIDEAGNIRLATSNAFLLDNTKPTVTDEQFSPDYRTAMPVTAELTFSEPVYVLEPHKTNILVTKDTVTFEDNGSVHYTFVDEAGNESTYTVEVDWIDHSLPTANVEMSADTWTNKPVDVTVSVEGEPPRALRHIQAPQEAELLTIKTIEGDILEQPQADMTVTEVVYRFHRNGTLTFVIEDLETGLTNDGQAKVGIIDLQSPTGELRYSEHSWTQNDVTVTLIASDDSGEAPEVWSEGGAEIVLEKNGKHTFKFRDAAGNEAELTAEVDWIVRETPEPTITYSTLTYTKDPVTVEISFEDETAPITITNHDSRTYTFEDNGTFTFHYEDAAGNVGSSDPITVSWIDRVKPTGTLSYSERGWTNQDVTVTLVAVDNSGSEITFLNEGGSQHTFTQNGSFTFTFRDVAGNVNSVEAVVDRIDKTPPKASIAYSTTEPTNAVVRAAIEPDEPGVEITNNNGSKVYDFHNNDSFTFHMVDRAGNKNTVTAYVNHIVREEPQVEVVYSTTELTNGNVIAAVKPIDPEQEIFVINNYRRSEYVFTENGTFTFLVQDEAGNQVEAEAVVNNIDKSTANIVLDYSETGPTQDEVTVTVQSDRELTVLNNGGNKQMTFTDNGIRWFHAMDAIGNEYWIEVVVQNIDREPPAVEYATGAPLLIPIGQAVDPAQGMQIIDQIDGDLTSEAVVQHHIDPNRPGEYKVIYEVSDRAGNVLQFERPARVISLDQLSVYVNGELPEEDAALKVRGTAIHLSQFGELGEWTAKWDQGYRLKGHFKTNGDWLDISDPITVHQYGYYTFFIMDQQRQYQLVHVYVVPN